MNELTTMGPISTLAEAMDENLKLAFEMNESTLAIVRFLCGGSANEPENNVKPGCFTDAVSRLHDMLCGTLNNIHVIRERLGA